MVLARAMSTGALTVSHGVGSRMPVHCSALGKVLLAGAEDPETVARVVAQRGLARQTANTIVDLDSLVGHLKMVGRRGWALDDEEASVGLRCLAAPVRDAAGAVVAAVGISGPTSRVTRYDVERLAGLVRGAAAAISASLGYRGRGDAGSSSAGG
jgi:IclR family acetate operon transcriptional repressor